jgi:bacterial/archaeal transporter family-2 protein
MGIITSVVLLFVGRVNLLSCNAGPQGAKRALCQGSIGSLPSDDSCLCVGCANGVAFIEIRDHRMVVWGYALALAAGISFVFQQAVNASLRAELGSAWWAGFVSYVGGTIVMLAVALLLREPTSWSSAIGEGRWLSWSGGIFGAIYIAVSIFLLPRFGAATVIALIVAGQMLGSLAFDHFGIFGLETHRLSSGRLLGVAFLVAGVVLVRL